MKNYALVISYAADHDVAVYLHDDIELAEKELRCTYEDMMKVCKEEGEYTVGSIEPDNRYAIIEVYEDESMEYKTDTIAYQIGSVYA